MALKVKTAGDEMSSARALRAVTPNDSTNLPEGPCRGLGCTASGAASVIALDDSTAVTIYLTAGSVHPVRAKRVLATGTAATGIVAYY